MASNQGIVYHFYDWIGSPRSSGTPRQMRFWPGTEKDSHSRFRMSESEMNLQAGVNWTIDWSDRRTRLRVLMTAIGVSLACVLGSLVALFPESMLFALLTDTGYTTVDGWVAALSGNGVQLVSVTLALFVAFRMIRWITGGRSDIDALEVAEMDESLQRIGRTGFIFLLLAAMALGAQILIILGELAMVERFGWIDAAVIEVRLFPQAFYLIFAEGSLIGALRRLLATNVEQPGEQSA